MRCYNGCPDSELQALLDKTKAIREQVQAIEPEAFCTYHNFSGYVIHIWGREISQYLPSPLRAWENALETVTRKTLTIPCNPGIIS